jgi:Ca2+-binding RTX toxin-like protein
VLVGGRDADRLTGGGGADRFVYAAAAESKGVGRDWILDLAAGDVIDLSAIDADSALAGDQAFALAAAFDGRSGLLVATYSARRDLTVFEADMNGDAIADMTIVASGDQTGFDSFAL